METQTPSSYFDRLALKVDARLSTNKKADLYRLYLTAYQVFQGCAGLYIASLFASSSMEIAKLSKTLNVGSGSYTNLNAMNFYDMDLYSWLPTMIMPLILIAVAQVAKTLVRLKKFSGVFIGLTLACYSVLGWALPLSLLGFYSFMNHEFIQTNRHWLPDFYIDFLENLFLKESKFKKTE